MKTLIAIDGSQEATTALLTAVNILRKKDNEIHLVCIAPSLALPAVADSKKRREISLAYQQHARQEGEKILDQARQALSVDGLVVKTRFDIGSPARLIASLAENFDITVVGAKGKATSNNPALGPVAGRVVEYAPGTILVVRDLVEAAELKVLLALDGSQASRQAVNVLLSNFDLDAAEITLLQVIETPWLQFGINSDWFESHGLGEVSDLAEPGILMKRELVSDANLLLENEAALLEQYCASVNLLTAEGNPAIEILGEAERGNYNLIIVGATGLSDARHRIIGSVSSKIVWQASTSVVVVKI